MWRAGRGGAGRERPLSKRLESRECFREILSVLSFNSLSRQDIQPRPSFLFAASWRYLSILLGHVGGAEMGLKVASFYLGDM